MKKFYTAISILMLAAFGLAACSTPTGTNVTQVPNSTATVSSLLPTGTSSAGGLPTATVASGTTPTAALTQSATTPTAETTQAATTPTAAMTQAATPATTGTPVTSGTPSANFTGQIVPLSVFLNWTVQSSDNQQVGKVAGVIVNGQSSSTASIPATGATATPAAVMDTPTPAMTTPTAAMATPTASANYGSGTGTTAANVPQISYLIVDVSQAAVTAVGNSNSGASLNATETPTAAMETPTAAAQTPTAAMQTPTTSASGGTTAAGEANYVLIPYQAVAFDQMTGAALSSAYQNNVLVVNSTAADVMGAQMYALNNLPDMTSANWASSIDQYWASTGVQIPATGANNGGTSPSTTGSNTFVITYPFKGFTLNDKSGANLATVNDFLVDVPTGKLLYAVISGSNLGSNYYAVPMSGFTYEATPNTAAAATETNAPTVSTFNSNYMASDFAQAPNVSLRNDFMLSSDWENQVNTYWQGVSGK